jgi:hypothetical protein
MYTIAKLGFELLTQSTSLALISSYVEAFLCYLILLPANKLRTCLTLAIQICRPMHISQDNLLLRLARRTSHKLHQKAKVHRVNRTLTSSIGAAASMPRITIGSNGAVRLQA